MTFDEALSATVAGMKVRHDGMGAGIYIAYNFKGFERWFESGDHCGFQWTDEDRAADWYEYEPPEPVAEPWPDAPAPVEPKRRRRRSQEPLPPVNDIGDWQAPQPAPMVNPWAAAGIGASPPEQKGWADYGNASGTD